MTKIQRILKSPTFATVSAGGKAVCKLPVGNKRYRAFLLKFKHNGALASEQNFRDLITNISFKINGTSRYDISASDLIDTQMKYKDRAFTTGTLIIAMADDYARTAMLEDVLSLDTFGLNTVDVEVDIGVGAVNPSLELTAVEDMPETGEVFNNLIFKEVRSFGYQVSGATTLEIADLPKGVGNIVAIHIKPSVVGAVDGVEIKADNVMIFNADLDINKQVLASISTRKPQNDWIHIDPVLLDRLSNAFPIGSVHDYRLSLKTNKATNFVVIYETVRAIS